MDVVKVVVDFLHAPLLSEKRARLWADDAVMEMPYSQKSSRVLEGKSEILDYAAKLELVLSPSRFFNLQCSQLAASDTVLVISDFEATVVSNGRVYRDKIVQLFRVHLGLIENRIEYFNPLALASALDGLSEPAEPASMATATVAPG